MISTPTTTILEMTKLVDRTAIAMTGGAKLGIDEMWAMGTIRSGEPPRSSGHRQWTCIRWSAVRRFTRCIRALGRTAQPFEPGGGAQGPVTVISKSYGLWQRSFSSALDVPGQSVTIERTRVTIVGVAPQPFFGVEVGRTVDVALPIRTFSLIGTAARLDDDAVWLTSMRQNETHFGSVRLQPDLSEADQTPPRPTTAAPPFPPAGGGPMMSAGTPIASPAEAGRYRIRWVAGRATRGFVLTHQG